MPTTTERGGVSLSPLRPDRKPLSLDQTPPERRTKGFSSTLWITQRGEPLAEEALKLNEFQGTLARVSSEGDIYLPLIFKDRSWVVKPDLYLICSGLPEQTTFRYGLKRLPITEVSFTKMDGRVKSLGDIFLILSEVERQYQGRARALEGAKKLAESARGATNNFQTGAHGGKERFCDQMGKLYKEAIGLVWLVYDEKKAESLEAKLKKDKKRVTKRASRKNGLEESVNRSEIATIMLRLEVEIDKIRRRQLEAEFLSQNIKETKMRIANRASSDRRAIAGLDEELADDSELSVLFQEPEKIEKNRGYLLGKLGTRIHLLEGVKLKPYKQVTQWLLEGLGATREKIEQGEYSDAQMRFQELRDSLKEKKEAARRAHE